MSSPLFFCASATVNARTASTGVLIGGTPPSLRCGILGSFSSLLIGKMFSTKIAGKVTEAVIGFFNFGKVQVAIIDPEKAMQIQLRVL